MEKKSIWKLVLQALISALTAVATALGVTSCIA